MHIGVSSRSFHAPLYAGSLHLADVPLAAYRLGLRFVELNDVFLTPSAPGRLARWFGSKPEAPVGPDYGRKSLMRMRQSRLRSGTRLACWTVETDLTVIAPEARRAQREYVGTAIEAARFLGAPILRMTLGGSVDDRAGVSRAIDLMRSVAPAAIASGVRLAIENHGGLSSEPGVLEEIVAAYQSGSGPSPVGVCLDFSHFDPGGHVSGVTRLAPLAIHVHAHTRAFDDRGEETTLDYAASLAALRAAGFDGVICIEYAGDSDPRKGILKSKALIEKYAADDLDGGERWRMMR